MAASIKWKSIDVDGLGSCRVPEGTSEKEALRAARGAKRVMKDWNRYTADLNRRKL